MTRKLKKLANLGLSAPEHQLAAKLRAFFNMNTDEVAVSDYDGETKSITITVADARILVAMEKYLKKSVVAGTTEVAIVVKAADEDVEKEKAEVTFETFADEMDALFYDVVSYMWVDEYEIDEENVRKYVMFRDNILLQFYADNAMNPYGMSTIVPADFVLEIVDLQGQASVTTEYVPAS